MRYGAPEQRVTWDCESECAVAREVWRYTIDGQTFLVNFENEAFVGSVAATRLVAGVLGSYFCGVDVERCRLTQLSQNSADAHGSSLLTPENVERLRQDDVNALVRATTTDDNSLRGDHPVEMVSHLYRLWDPASGSPVALVVYALRSADLALPTIANAGTAAVTLTVRQWDGDARARIDTAVTLAMPEGSRAPPSEVSGYFWTRSTSAVTSWSVAAAQEGQRAGRAYEVGGGAIPAGPLQLSDMVLGPSPSAVVAALGHSSVAVDPVGIMKRTLPVSLYFEAKSSSARPSAAVSIVVSRADDNRHGAALFQASFARRIDPGVNEVVWKLDLSRLAAGSYWLDVRVADGGHVLATRRTLLLLQ
ncbi:MAG TPA: hypothetical protein VHW65_11645 [Gemmatimonadales bacterium]|nr:hypothetical protein [Gemmatimonadales bacterium]